MNTIVNFRKWINTYLKLRMVSDYKSDKHMRVGDKLFDHLKSMENHFLTTMTSQELEDKVFSNENPKTNL
jgi:hypothetical protein